MKRPALNILCAVAAILMAAPGYAQVGTNYKFIWQTPVPMDGVTSDQVLLSNFTSSNYVAAAMCCAPTAMTVTNGNGSTIVFGALNSACPITGGNGSGYWAGICTNLLGGNTGFSNLLNWNYYDGNIHLITIPNLVPGQQYLVELFSLDDRAIYALNRGYVGPETTSWQDPTNASDISQAYLELPSKYIIGLLNASNTTEQIRQNLGVGYGNFNAIVVRTEGTIPPQYWIAAPSSIGNEYSGGHVSWIAQAIEDTALPVSPISYQWQMGPVGGPYRNIPANRPAKWTGVNTTNLTISNLAPSDGNLAYAVIASNAYGAITDVVTIGTISQFLLPVPVTSPPPGTLIGQWISGPASFAEQTGQYAGAHDAYDIAATYGSNMFGGNSLLEWTNDVPPNAPAGAMALYCDNDGLFVTNSSTLEANYAGYAGDYDTNIALGFTVVFWAKGWPGSGNPFVSKYGETEAGWQFRTYGWNYGSNAVCFTVRNNNSGSLVTGMVFAGNEDDLGSVANTGNDGQWHQYAGTFNAISGLRKIYNNGILVGQDFGNTAYDLAVAEHLCIGAKDSPPGNSFGNQYTGEIYDVRIYNYPFSGEELAAVGRFTPTMTVATNHQTGQLALIWPFGHLVSATNLAGPWVSNSAAPPFTITTSPTNAQLFFRVENP